MLVVPWVQIQMYPNLYKIKMITLFHHSLGNFLQHSDLPSLKNLASLDHTIRELSPHLNNYINARVEINWDNNGTRLHNFHLTQCFLTYHKNELGNSFVRMWGTSFDTSQPTIADIPVEDLNLSFWTVVSYAHLILE